MRDALSHLDPKQCALLVVDIQENLMKVIHGQEEVAKNAALLIRAAKELAVPVIPTTQYVARIGPFVAPVAEALGEVPALDKLEFGCFNNEAIRAAVKKLAPAVNTLVVCGVETHICVYQTVLGALNEGFRVWVAADAVSSRVKKNYKLGLARLREMGAVVGTTEMIIYDWLGKAGTPEFRALLPYLK
ncbi:MAG: isochorismatase family protein [Thermodesulfobacteriota bacterium]